jgi:peptidoglycan/xylan/chitin deacetylase (PgdA/CDA1 family)
MNTLILAYHRVNDWSEDSLTVHPAIFRRQLEYLSRKYRVVPLSELVEMKIKGLRSKDRLAAVTFDDGYFDNYRYAFPILKNLNFAATFFLTAGLIGTSRLLPRDQGKENAEKNRLLGWEETTEMKRAGFTFGSHSLTHANLASVGSVQAWKEIEESKKVLEAHLQEPVVFFCYPFGSYSPEVKKMVADVGYRAAFVTPSLRGVNFIKRRLIPEDRYSLKRVGIYHHTTHWQFRLKTK